MREYTIEGRDAGKRLDRWLLNELPLLPAGLAQKYIRLKRVKVNGRGAQRDVRLSEGDRLQLYIGEEFFERPKRVDPLLSGFHPHLNILYEDERMLLIDKRPGLLVHPDEQEKLNTLVTHVRAYLYQKGVYDSMDPTQFSPVPVNRIDRFTGGIVIVAKSEQAMRMLNQKIRDREVEKRYLCIVQGPVRPTEGQLEGYIVKQPGQRRVSVQRHPVEGGQHALTRYRTLAQHGPLTLLECELVTGRTHQIRAQLAAAGHPLLGDNQYGDSKFNQRYGRGHQALYAYRLQFCFTSGDGVFDDLNGRCWQVREVPFVREYFPGQPLPPVHET